MNTAPADRQCGLDAILRAAPVVAVVTIARVEHALPMARALVAGGIRAIEITLRTPAALDAIRAIADAVPQAIPGAGTVLDDKSLQAAARAGARFCVAPGTTAELLRAVDDSPLPFLPGAATASEAMALFERGYRLQKFFPAAAAGGIAALRALGGPLPGIGFCPTGGVSSENAADYLQLPNVVCVGGSWLTPARALQAGDWAAITALARAAAQLGQA
jgi:2-dehydro-3-deoxyphosphogluconate aldolase/(4S)-4-hydroxy-2-oxoglutarate aldolase